MASMRTARLVVVGSLGALAVASCFVQGFELIGGGSDTGSGGGPPPDANGAGGPDVCAHATWPVPPASSDPGSDQEIVVAIRSIDFGEESVGTGSGVGYDLDNRCTCQGEGPSCLEPEWAGADHCDAPEGRDNATAQLFKALSVFSDALSSEQNSQGAANGDWTLLIRIRQYQGQLNDEQVVFSLYPSPGRDNDPCLATGYTPLWDGTDEWPVAADSLVGSGGSAGSGGAAGSGGSGTGEGGCPGDAGTGGLDINQPKYSDSAAYVTNGVVVANLPTAELVFSSMTQVIKIKITAGFMTARIEHDVGTNRWLLHDGLLVGRLKISDFLGLLGTFEAQDMPLCTDHPLYEVVKNAVCDYPDVASELGGPTTPCDALSFGMGFEAESARLGRIWKSPAEQTLCDPAVDPANDHCE